LKKFVYFDKIEINSGGAPTSLARKIAAAKKSPSESEGGQKFLPPTPFLFARTSRIHLESFQEICSKIVRAEARTHHHKKYFLC